MTRTQSQGASFIGRTGRGAQYDYGDGPKTLIGSYFTKQLPTIHSRDVEIEEYYVWLSRLCVRLRSAKELQRLVSI
jgi:hypothetical protein